jgi:hypothetical protein
MCHLSLFTLHVPFTLTLSSASPESSAPKSKKNSTKSKRAADAPVSEEYTPAAPATPSPVDKTMAADAEGADAANSKCVQGNGAVLIRPHQTRLFL